ncbi:MAG: UMP kinase [Desulfobacteraceae bacterium]|nr:MAG: UMP kinase [Desulfobacteraceae bacterium]
MNDIRPGFKRILLKLSGEALSGDKGFGIDPSLLLALASEIAEVSRSGVEMAIVVGGGNIFRGLRSDNYGLDRVVGDHMGMLATVINSLALAQAIESKGCKTAVMSAIQMPGIAGLYVRERALELIADGRVVLPAAGTGNPFFTTDTAAALRALELSADALFKATKVDGVYDSDPESNPSARPYAQLSYRDVIAGNLKVMDLTAVSLAMENKLPIVVFNIRRPGSILSAVKGENIGTFIKGDVP